MIIAHIRDNFANAFFPRLSEWYCAVVLMGLGFVLAANPELMASSKTTAYQLLLMIASQETWSVIMRLFAAVRLLILLINGAWTRSPHLRSASAFVTCFFWTQITLSFLPIFGLAFIMAAGLLALDFANAIRAARDARLIDTAYPKGRQASGQD